MSNFEPIPGAEYKYDYLEIFRMISSGRIDRMQTFRKLAQDDLFFLLYWGLRRLDVHHSFIVSVIREVERDHSDTVDLWAREHYKSTILTYGLPIQELLRNPEERIGIFSHTRSISKGFLRQIKHTLESSVPVKKWFPDILWADPKRQAPTWSENDGLIVRRKTTPKEASVEAWGLTDGQPTSKHFSIRIYDDVVTEDSVTNTEQLRKTVKCYELSHSLGTDGGSKRLVGTHYHFADLYMTQRKRSDLKEAGKIRVKPATDDGTPTGTPVLLSRARLDELRRDQGPYVFACQQLLSPVSTENMTFRPEWIQHYERLPSPLNVYIITDPANEKKTDSDYTALVVVGVDQFGNYYWMDGRRARLSLTERWDLQRDMWLKWHRDCQRVGYEKYGMQSDITYFEEKQREEKVFFKVHPLGGQIAKPDRIRRLVAPFEAGKFYIPFRMMTPDGDLVKYFVDEEYETFPYSAYYDLIDAMSRIMDEQMKVRRPAPRPMQAVRAKTDYQVLKGASCRVA